MKTLFAFLLLASTALADRWQPVPMPNPPPPTPKICRTGWEWVAVGPPRSVLEYRYVYQWNGVGWQLTPVLALRVDQDWEMRRVRRCWR